MLEFDLPTTPAERAAAARAEGYADGLRAAIAVCEKVRAESRGYHLPQMAMGAAKCIEDLQALIPVSPHDHAQVTACIWPSCGHTARFGCVGCLRTVIEERWP